MAGRLGRRIGVMGATPMDDFFIRINQFIARHSEL
jgi:hypothetical protein